MRNNREIGAVRGYCVLLKQRAAGRILEGTAAFLAFGLPGCVRGANVGDGIGGPIAAIAMKRVGIEAVVYEAHAGPSDSSGLS